jgi:GxxExxY protein
VPNRSLNTQLPASQRIVEKELSYTIVGCFFSVYNELGYGFTESVYLKALQVALQQAGLLVEREVPVTVVFRGVEVGTYRIDMLVEGRIIVEVKSSERIADAAKRQVRNYLCAAKLELSLLLHFGPRPAFHRILRAADYALPEDNSSDSADSDVLL